MARILTAIIGIPLLICIVKYTSDFVCTGLIFIAMLLALREYFGLIHDTGRQERVPSRTGMAFQWLGYVLASFILLTFAVSNEARMPALPIAFFAAPALLLMLSLVVHNNLNDALHSSAFTLFGAWYVGGLMGFIVGVRKIVGVGVDLLLLLLVVVWANDIFAFLAGKAFGRHALAPVVSPKKTVEGAAAGLVFGILAAAGYAHFFLPGIGLKHAILVGALIGFAGQIGDLCESMLKRAAKVKDSGAIVPGHGGMLDRLDSLLFGAPAMYYYFYFFLQK